MWRHRTIADPRDLPATPPAVPPEAAQEWCNFVVWAAAGLPAGTQRLESPPGRVAGHTSSRPDWSESNCAAYRFEVVGAGGRARVKQFHYDWAFPALDHPCLWRSQTRAVALDDRHVVWFGTDFLGHPAASARLGRTTVELSVLDGRFTQSQILEVYRSLRPAVPEAAEQIAKTPFSELSYWARHPGAVTVVVPIGLWKLPRQETHRADWSAAQHGLPRVLGGLPLDSAARWSSGETEAVYLDAHGRELRLIVQRRGGGALRVPAEPEAEQPGHRTADGFQLGWIDERYGPFHAVFASDAVEAMLLSSTGVGLDRAWFTGAVQSAMRYCADAGVAGRG